MSAQDRVSNPQIRVTSCQSSSLRLLQGKQSLDGLPGLLSCIAANNATLSWLLLHGMAGQQHSKQSTAVSKQSAAVAKQGVDEKAVVGLLLDTAAFESWVRYFLVLLACQRSWVDCNFDTCMVEC